MFNQAINQFQPYTLSINNTEHYSLENGCALLGYFKATPLQYSIWYFLIFTALCCADIALPLEKI